MTPEMQRFVIIGRTGCTWCTKVAELILERGHMISNLYYDPATKACNQLYTFLHDSNLKTVPQVFLNGWLLGGYEETKEYLDSVSPISSDLQLRHRSDRDSDKPGGPSAYDPDVYQLNF